MQIDFPPGCLFGLFVFGLAQPGCGSGCESEAGLFGSLWSGKKGAIIQEFDRCFIW